MEYLKNLPRLKPDIQDQFCSFYFYNYLVNVTLHCNFKIKTTILSVSIRYYTSEEEEFVEKKDLFKFKFNIYSTRCRYLVSKFLAQLFTENDFEIDSESYSYMFNYLQFNDFD